MKTLLKLFFFSFLIISLSGCGDDTQSENDNSQSSQNEDSGDEYNNDDGGGYQDGMDSGYSEGQDNQNDGENRDNDRGNDKDNDRDQNSRKGLENLPLLGDSEGNATLNTNRNYRFKILGDVNATIGGRSYPLKAAFDYRGITLSTGYRFDPIFNTWHIQVVGYDIDRDRLNQNTGSIMLKFDMPDMNTTGTYKLKFPQNAYGEVVIHHIEPYINNSYIIVGSVTNAQIYNQEGTSTVGISSFFQTGLMPLYK